MHQVALRDEPAAGERDEITSLLLAWRGGDERALAALMSRTYRDLKKIAGRLLHRERRKQTLETTALVHEAYLRLADLERIGWRDRVHFFAMSARIMRRVLVDHARRRGRAKRGNDPQRVALDTGHGVPAVRAPDLVALDDALRDLAVRDPQRATIVELRFFGGLGREEIAEVLGISATTVSRRWRSSRAWLVRYLGRKAV